MSRSFAADTPAPRPVFEPSLLAAGEEGAWCVAARLPLLVHIDAKTNAVAGTVDLASALGWPRDRQVHQLAVDAAALWVAAGDCVVRVDPASHEVKAVIPVPPHGLEGNQPAVSLTVDEHGVWVAGAFQDVIRRIDPAADAITHMVPVRRSCHSPVAAFGSIWMLNGLDGPICRIDPATGEVVAEIDTGGRATRPMQVGAGFLIVRVADNHWEAGSRLVRILPETNTVSFIPGPPPDHWYASHDALWVPDPVRFELRRRNPETGDVAAIIDLVGHRTWTFAAGNDLWAIGLSAQSGHQRWSVVRVDTSTNELTAVIGLGDVEIPPGLIAKPLPRLEQQAFAEQVLGAVRRDVFAGGYTVDQWTGEAHQVPWHKGISFEKVTLDQSDGGATIVLLFRSDSHPDCLFGYGAAIPFDPAAASHNPEEEAMYLTLPLDEQLAYNFLPEQCDPDDNGVTWLQ